MNKVILIGGVGRDPEVRTFQNGGRVVSFSVATSERWRDKNTGERKERTEWHSVNCFNEHIGKVAEQYVRKGSKVAIEGQIQTREYTDKDGNQREVTEIVIPMFGGSLELLGDGGKREERAEPEPSGRASPPRRGGSLKDQLDDDIPFAPEWR